MPVYAYASGGTVATYEDCVSQFFFSAEAAKALFIQDNSCYFGMPTNTAGSIALTGTSWTVYIKQSGSSNV
jgi:hypothetical protein